MRVDDFETLAKTHAPRVLGYLLRRSTPDDAADVWQEVLVIAWRRQDRLPGTPDEQLAWLLATARRTLANHRRGQVRRSAATERLADELWLAVQASGSDHDPVREAMTRLQPGDCELLQLIYWDDLTSEQAATVLGIRAAACRKRLQRAREQVARELGQRVGPAPEASATLPKPSERGLADVAQW